MLFVIVKKNQCKVHIAPEIYTGKLADCTYGHDFKPIHSYFAPAKEMRVHFVGILFDSRETAQRQVDAYRKRHDWKLEDYPEMKLDILSLEEFEHTLRSFYCTA